MINFKKLETKIPFTSLYAYVDSYENASQTTSMFIANKLHPYVSHTFTKDRRPYQIRVIRVLKKNEKTLENIFGRMLNIYGSYYEEYCREFEQMLDKNGGEII